MSQISFYVDYDEDPDIGDCQGIFPIQGDDLDQLMERDPNWSKTGGVFKALLGSKILSIVFQEDRTLKFTVEI
jgi:hypothetical protein